AGRGEAAIAAAAANRLRDDAVSMIARCAEQVGVRHVDFIANAAGAAFAAERDTHADRILRGAERRAEAEAAIAAATADRLRDDRIRRITGRRDRAVIGGRN